MDPELVEAKLASDRIAREAELWQALDSMSLWKGRIWAPLLLVCGGSFLILASDLPSGLMSALVGVLLLNLATQILQSQRLRVVAELVRLTLKK